METFLEKLQKSKGKTVNILMKKWGYTWGSSSCFGETCLRIFGYRKEKCLVFWGKLVDANKIWITVNINGKDEQISTKYVESIVETDLLPNSWEQIKDSPPYYFGFCKSGSIRQAISQGYAKIDGIIQQE